MTGTLRLLLVLTILYGCNHFPKDIQVTDAGKHIGETVRTGGMVYHYEWINQGKTTLLHIGKDVSHQDLTIIIADNTKGFTINPSTNIKHPEPYMKEDWTGATGQIINYQGKPAIRINSWDDIIISKLVMDEMMSPPNK